MGKILENERGVIKMSNHMADYALCQGVKVAEPTEDLGNPDTANFSDFFSFRTKRPGNAKPERMAERKKKVLAMVEQGLNVKEIARGLKISYDTVRIFCRDNDIKVKEQEFVIPLVAYEVLELLRQGKKGYGHSMTSTVFYRWRNFWKEKGDI